LLVVVHSGLCSGDGSAAHDAEGSCALEAKLDHVPGNS
jgi:hypothetical protein